jgi:hypothetical protein
VETKRITVTDLRRTSLAALFQEGLEVIEVTSGGGVAGAIIPGPLYHPNKEMLRRLLSCNGNDHLPEVPDELSGDQPQRDETESS